MPHLMPDDHASAVPDTDGRATTPSTRSLGHRVGTGAAWITLEMISVQVVSVIVFAVLAHFVGPRQFGLISISFVLIYASRWILFENIGNAVARKEHPTDLEFTTAFWMTLGVSVAGFAALELATLFVEDLFHAPGLSEVLRAMGVILVVMGLSRTHECWLKRHFHFQSLAVRSAIAAVVGGVAGIGGALMGWGVWALVAQQVVMALTAVICLWLASPWRPGLVFSRSAAREIALFARDMAGNSALNTFNESCDTLLVALFFGPESVGLYSTGKRLKLALHLVAAAPINGVAMPALAEVQGSDARLRQVLLTATALVFGIGTPIFLGTSAISRDAITLLFGERWAGSAPVLSLLAVGGLFSISLTYSNTVFAIKNRQIWSVGIGGVYTLLSLAFFWGLKLIGSKMIAAPFVLPFIVTFPVSIALMLRITGLGFADWFRMALPSLAAGTLMWGGVAFLSPFGPGVPILMRLAGNIALGGLVYGGAFWLLGRRIVLDIVGTLRRRPAHG